MGDNQMLGSTYYSPLFILSFFIVFVTCYISLSLVWKRRRQKEQGKHALLMGSAAAFGTGLWAMESVNFLAFPLFDAHDYHYVYALLSLLIGVGSTYVSFRIAAGAEKNMLRLFASYFVVVSGFFVMRHVSVLGVSEMMLSYNKQWMIACAAISVVLAFFFVWFFYYPLFFERLNVLYKTILSFMVTFAVGAIHYTALLAMRFTVGDGNELHSVHLPLQSKWLAAFIVLFFVFLFMLMIVIITMEREIRKQQTVKRAIFRSSLDSIIVTNEQSSIMVINPVARQLFQDDVTGQSIFSFLPEFANVDQLIGKRLETKLQLHEDEYKTIELTVTKADLDGEQEYIFSMRDVTEQKQVKEELNETHDRYEQLFHDAPLAIVVHRNGRVISANEEAMRLLRVTNRKNVIGQSLLDFVAIEEHDVVNKMLQTLMKPAGHQEVIYNQVRIFNAEKEDMYVQAKSHVIKIKGVPYIQTILHDVSEQQKVKKTVQYMAYQDVVTGLPTAGLFHTLANNALERMKKRGGSAALLLIDFDRFKYVTDTHGTEAGDQFLKEAVRRIQQLTLSTDILSRYGTDSFFVLLQNRDRQQVIQTAGELLDGISAPFQYGKADVYMSASIGMTMFPDDGMALDTLIHQADVAMYHAKKHQRNSFTFYDTIMHEVSTKRMMLEEGLRRAVMDDEFELHYQPKIDSKSGRIVGVEALMRWNHPTLGKVSPGEFIPIAEETGFILAISEWALKTACRQNKKWQEQGLPPMRVAVNISSVDFGQESFVPMVMKVLKETKLNPNYLELEITETVAIKNMEVVIEKLHILKNMGIYISIDDFGAGYSSLSYIRKLPIHALKIDKSFIQDLTDDEKEETIVKAIITLGKSLDLEIVAEGVEEEQQAKLLMKEQCHEMQGYYFSRPLPAHELVRQAGEIEEKARATRGLAVL